MCSWKSQMLQFSQNWQKSPLVYSKTCIKQQVNLGKDAQKVIEDPAKYVSTCT
jgi:hypothetical protein